TIERDEPRQVLVRRPRLTPDVRPDSGILGAEAPHGNAADARGDGDACLIKGGGRVEEPDLVLVASGPIAQDRVAGAIVPHDRAVWWAARCHDTREGHARRLRGARDRVVAIVAETHDELLGREAAQRGDLIPEPPPGRHRPRRPELRVFVVGHYHEIV